MRTRRLRSSLCQLIGSQKAFACAHIGQTIQLSDQWLRQIVHTSIIAEETHEGERSTHNFMNKKNIAKKNWCILKEQKLIGKIFFFSIFLYQVHGSLGDKSPEHTYDSDNEAEEDSSTSSVTGGNQTPPVNGRLGLDNASMKSHTPLSVKSEHSAGNHHNRSPSAATMASNVSGHLSGLSSMGSPSSGLTGISSTSPYGSNLSQSAAAAAAATSVHHHLHQSPVNNASMLVHPHHHQTHPLLYQHHHHHHPAAAANDWYQAAAVAAATPTDPMNHLNHFSHHQHHLMHHATAYWGMYDTDAGAGDEQWPFVWFSPAPLISPLLKHLLIA